MTEERSSVRQITRMIDAARAGDPRAAADLLPALYDELRRLARSLLSRRAPGQTLQPTALVHEAYLRLTGSESREWDSNGHFFAAAAQAMREILVREARRKSAAKRGGGRKRVELDEDALAIEPPSDDMLELDDALGRLEKAEPWKARIVMLRYFAGLTTADTAKLLGTSTATVEREWRYIRAWLARELAKGREKS